MAYWGHFWAQFDRKVQFLDPARTTPTAPFCYTPHRGASQKSTDDDNLARSEEKPQRVKNLISDLSTCFVHVFFPKLITYDII